MDRGYIYLVDHEDSGLPIAEITGEAREMADYLDLRGTA